MGTRGPGAFDHDDARDLLDPLTRQDPVSRRKTLERIFRTTREHPQDLNWTLGPAEVVAAAAAVAAGLPAGEAVVQEIAGYRYDMAALTIPDSGPELASRRTLPAGCQPAGCHVMFLRGADRTCRVRLGTPAGDQEWIAAITVNHEREADSQLDAVPGLAARQIQPERVRVHAERSGDGRWNLAQPGQVRAQYPR